MSSAERRNGKLTGRWIGEVRLKGQPPFKKKGFKSKAEADGYEAYVKASGEEPPHTGPHKHTGVTFRDVADLCKQAGGPRRGRWKAERDHSVLQRLEHINTVLGDMDIAAVTTTELDRLVTSLQRRPGNKGARLSPATINRYLTAASAVLTFASARGYIQGKPVIPLQEEDGAREETVSEELEASVLHWLREQDMVTSAVCVSVLIETGMRAGELQAVTPEQITVETVMGPDGEHEENGWIRLRANQVKTKTARMVWIRPELARDFRAIVAAGARPKAYTLARNFKSALKAGGHSGGLVIHSLRHTRATRLLESGVDPQITMEMLGWTSFNTMTRYRHVKPAMHVEAAKKVSRAGVQSGQMGTIVPFIPKRTA